MCVYVYMYSCYLCERMCVYVYVYMYSCYLCERMCVYVYVYMYSLVYNNEKLKLNDYLKKPMLFRRVLCKSLNVTYLL